MLRRFTRIVTGMVVYPERMRENLERSRGVVFSGTVLLELARRGVSREQAYEWVQRNAMRSFHEQRDFKALLLADPDVTRGAAARPRSSARSTSTSSLRHVDHIFDRVFQDASTATADSTNARARVRHTQAVGLRSAGHDRRRSAALARLRRRQGRPAGQVLRARHRRAHRGGAAALAAEAADKLLANPVIESYRIEVD